MVSPLVAQAILSQEAPDIVGSFRAGQQEARAAQTKKLAGQALQQGGGSALEELQGLDPEIALAIGVELRSRSANDINDFIRDSKIGLGMLRNNDFNGALSFARQRRNTLAAQGRDTAQTDKLVGMLESGNFEEAKAGLEAFATSLDTAKAQTSSQRDRAALLEDLKSDNKQVRQSAEVALGLRGRASQRLTAEEESEIEAAKAAGKAEGKGREERQQDSIDRGLAAADSTSNLRRTMELLDSVGTGGFESASLRAKQLFGVEGADEGELSNALGTAVLSQLKATFGAAFTAQEGERLERLSAGFSKSPAANRRIISQALKIAERSAQRGIRAARARGDDEAAQQIEDALEFSLGGDDGAVQASNTDSGVLVAEDTPQADADGAGNANVTPTGRTATNPETGQRAQEMSDGTWRVL